LVVQPGRAERDPVGAEVARRFHADPLADRIPGDVHGDVGVDERQPSRGAVHEAGISTMFPISLGD
jgi:hypothetical protein